MHKLRLFDVRTSRLPSVVGLCQGDSTAIANLVNSAQRRLIYAPEGRDEGWHGTWSEVVFNVSRSKPYITLPRDIARLEAIDVCDNPVKIRNQFFEYLTFGNGRLPKNRRWCCQPRVSSAFTRNNAVTFVDMTVAPQYLVAYMTDAQDLGKRVLFQGLDASGVEIFSQDVQYQANGVFVALDSPSAITPMTFSQINGIQKDVTVGQVRIYQHDPNTGDEILLLTMEPSEQTALYRRYYLSALPQNCCQTNAVNTDQVQVTALAKLDLIPVVADTDYLLIQNLEAIIQECQSIRYSEMDTAVSKQMSQNSHKEAIQYLNGELNHFIGKDEVAVGFSPFGSARLSKQKIGSLL